MLKRNRCTGCDRLIPPPLLVCPGCAASGGRPADPYADALEAFDEEISPARVAARPTPKRLTDSSPSFGRTRPESLGPRGWERI